MNSLIIGILMLVSPLSPKALAPTSVTLPTPTDRVMAYSSVPEKVPANAKSSDWNLVIINRNNQKNFPAPKLSLVGGKYVDSRIAGQTEAFLKAAQAINPQEKIISAYRSPSLQSGLYDEYVQEEMSEKNISKAAAEKVVQTYSQPAGASEHETGLAIDMSSKTSLNSAPAAEVEKLNNIAANYGFIQRFPAWGKASTGIGYEDWHWRYVGVDNAKYIVNNHLTLEEYVKLLDQVNSKEKSK